MKKIINYKLFESKNKNIEILEDIICMSYLIEDEGFKIVYFVTFLNQVSDDFTVTTDNSYTYALGSSYDIQERINSIEYNKILRVALEIVNDIPRTIGYEKVLKSLEEDGLFDHLVKSFELILGDSFEIERTSGGRPPYIFFYPKNNIKI